MMSIDARPAAAQTAAQATTLSSAERRFLHVGTARPFVGADNQRHRQNGAHPDSRRVLPLGAGAGPRRALIVRHDDAAREAACDGSLTSDGWRAGSTRPARAAGSSSA